jgi:hypothetical protein
MQSGDDVNPPSNNVSTSECIDTYKYLTNEYAKKSSYFHLNTDSQNILYTLADPNGANAGISYNGDFLYAAVGAGNSD